MPLDLPLPSLPLINPPSLTRLKRAFPLSVFRRESATRGGDLNHHYINAQNKHFLSALIVTATRHTATIAPCYVSPFGPRAILQRCATIEIVRGEKPEKSCLRPQPPRARGQ